MPIVKKHGSGAPILGALVGGQAQAAERQRAQALEQQRFLAQLLQQQQQFQAQERARREEMAQRNKLALLQTQESARDRAARFGLAQLGHRQDLQRLAFQGQQNAAFQQQRMMAELEAQAQQRSMLRDENIWRANIASMDSEASALLKHQFPTQEAFDQAWAQHNRKRQMMGISPMDSPPWSQPPPDKNQMAWGIVTSMGLEGQVPMDLKTGGPDFRAFSDHYKHTQQGMAQAKQEADDEAKRKIQIEKAVKDHEDSLTRARIKDYTSQGLNPDGSRPAEKPKDLKDTAYIEYTPQGRRWHIMQRFEAYAKSNSSMPPAFDEDGIPLPPDPVMLTPELQQRWGEEYDAFMGKTPAFQPRPTTLSDDRTRMIDPGSEDHKAILLSSIPPSFREEVRGQPILVKPKTSEQAEAWKRWFQTLEPNTYYVLDPVTGQIDRWVKTSPSSRKPPTPNLYAPRMTNPVSGSMP